MNTLDASIRLGELIRVSPYFDYHFVAGRPGWFVKVPTRRRGKNYFGLRVRYPTSLYTAVKFGLLDLVAYERSAFDRLRPHIGEYLPRDIHEALTDAGQKALCGEWPLDYDGAPARMICQHGRVDNAPFWRHVDAVVQRLRERRLMLLGAFTGLAAGVLVHKTSADEWKPVLLDVLKSGPRFYYYQFWMHVGAEFWKKFDRGLAQFKAAYGRPVEGTGIATADHAATADAIGLA